MRKNFILDTNVLLYDPNAINIFANNTVIIPLEVIEQLDTFKRDITELGNNARAVIQQLDLHRQNAKLGEGVRLDNGSLLRVFAGECENMLANTGLELETSFDNRILNLAMYLNEHDADTPTIIVTKSINLRIKADALGIYAEDYAEQDKHRREVGVGYHEFERDPEEIEQFLHTGHCILEQENGALAPNEYVLFKAPNDGKEQALGRITQVSPTKVSSTVCSQCWGSRHQTAQSRAVFRTRRTARRKHQPSHAARQGRHRQNTACRRCRAFSGGAERRLPPRDRLTTDHAHGPRYRLYPG